jgi:hypothetical protein
MVPGAASQFAHKALQYLSFSGEEIPRYTATYPSDVRFIPKPVIDRWIRHVRLVPKADVHVLWRYVSAPAAARSRNQVTPAIGRRRAAGRQLSPSRSLLKIALFSSPATKKAACRLLSSAG